MIDVKNLYHDYAGNRQYAVEDVSFTIEKGEIFGFLGPSGAGKSTVQNIMTGLLKLQKGEVNYKNQSIRSVGSDFFNNIGVSFEHPNLYSKLTGYENLKYYAGLFKVAIVDPMILLERVGLKEAANKKAGEYSKGMKQRLVFARALINNPEILFLDEPLSGLDPSTGNKIKNMILEKKQEGSTIFLTTHNMYLAEEVCNRVAFINEGKIIAMDSPRNLKLKYGEKSVKVEYREENRVKADIFFLENEKDRFTFNQLINTKEIQTIHSQEATLEEIFIKLTGRGLV
ncbi:fluoroquinolone transport system ATP-binding protein [Anaerovirgula multivorans]|uniref:Fluoroquinolone transport system ATP-binding protein n=1 Tax=Anaerovirgula multivorans TaxID=312168 RepID=A0A239AHH8_9FIRM|nr:ABC transporter ATP-binding protein [Anaerovirgula multivorans]SNR94822.1 fluoroquinolone transport system ATP-binding protein [Anaerovirgula multivorans]